MYSVVVADGSVPTCVSVMTKYRAKGLLQSDVPSQAVAGKCSVRAEKVFLLNTLFSLLPSSSLLNII